MIDSYMTTDIFDAEGKKYFASKNGNLISGSIHIHNDYAYAVIVDVLSRLIAWYGFTQMKLSDLPHYTK